MYMETQLVQSDYSGQPLDLSSLPEPQLQLVKKAYVQVVLDGEKQKQLLDFLNN